MTEKIRCVAKVSNGARTFHWHQCKHSGTLEHEGKLYCKMHHPPTVREKRDAKSKAYAAKLNAQWDRQARHQARADAYPQLAQAIKDLLTKNNVTNRVKAGQLLKDLGELK